VLAACLPALAIFDYWSGPDFGFSLFYLVPIGVAAWRLSGSLPIVLAVASAACWLAADLPYHGATMFSLWNGFTRLAMYLAFALLTQRVRRNRDDLASLNRQLESLLRHERELARTDPLTGLPNRRLFDDALRRAVARNRRDGKPVAIGVFDLDHFKRLNDTRGHAVGDDALRSVAAALTSVVRAGDVAARLGGDEFAVVFHDCDAAAAHAAAARVLDAVMASLSAYATRDLGVTAGVGCFSRLPDDLAAIVAEADRALYAAKRGGRGRVIVSAVPAAAAPS
jgi:diguanylate cyclase (GGDEF)-like protein